MKYTSVRAIAGLNVCFKYLLLVYASILLIYNIHHSLMMYIVTWSSLGVTFLKISLSLTLLILAIKIQHPYSRIRWLLNTVWRRFYDWCKHFVIPKAILYLIQNGFFDSKNTCARSRGRT